MTNFITDWNIPEWILWSTFSKKFMKLGYTNDILLEKYLKIRENYYKALKDGLYKQIDRIKYLPTKGRVGKNLEKRVELLSKNKYYVIGRKRKDFEMSVML